MVSRTWANNCIGRDRNAINFPGGFIKSPLSLSSLSIDKLLLFFALVSNLTELTHYDALKVNPLML